MAEMKDHNQLARAMRKTTPYFALLLLGLMLLGNPVLAQNEPSSEEFMLEDIVVTGSVLRTKGMNTPTPVTVVTMEELELTAPTTMIEGLAQLPQFYGSNTTQLPGNYWQTTGAGSLNLRSLESKRTLQLLDGRRVVDSTIFGGPDINLFPEFLIKSVETVTGGASAAYGTGAVAGAVNFILNTDYEGIQAKIQYGVTEKGDNQSNKFQIAGGFALTDRIHVLFSAEKEEQDPIWGYDVLDYDWYDGWALIENPDTANRGTSPDNPYFIPVRQMRSMNASLDGILHFPDPIGRYIWENGQFVPFVMGDPCNAHGCSTVNGGSNDDIIFESQNSQITPETSRENLFGYIEFDVNDNLTVYGQGIYAKADFTNINAPGLFPQFQRAFTIYSGNPFLPADMQQIMDDNGLNSVTFSRIGSREDIGFDAYLAQENETLSLTGGLEYEVDSGFFEGWQVRSYFQYGEAEVKAPQRGGIRLDRIYLAADVVIDPLTGQPACNVTVTSRDAGTPIYEDCVPLNLFGRGNASAEAVDWVTGFEPGVPIHAEGVIGDETLPHDYVSGVNKQRVINIDQYIFDIRADGEIYEGWGAGPVNMGVGYGYREESFTQVVEVGPGGNINADPEYRPVMANDETLGIRGVPGGAAASGNLVEIQFSNVPFARGSQDVHEAFTEVLVPLITDKSFIKQLNFSGAARWATYSGPGTVWSWKTGLDYSITDEIRLRGTVSQDVRAATIAEKYDRTGGLQQVTDYLEDPAGGSSSRYNVTIFSNGSPDIEPESARTNTVGVVYVPKWLDGFTLSTDWYSVEVTDNITRLTAADVVSGCYQDGNVDLCQYIYRTAEPSPINPTINRISLVGLPYFNQASVKATGVDFEAGYTRYVDWFGGGESVGLRLLGTYLGERSNTDSAGNKTELQGTIDAATGIPLPEWTAILSGFYRRGPFGLSMQARYRDDVLINRNWNYNGSSTRWDVFDNVVDSEILVDARVNYIFEIFGSDLELYVNINNVLDKDPEPYLAGAFNSYFFNDTGLGVANFSDRRGRRYAVGLRFEHKY